MKRIGNFLFVEQWFKKDSPRPAIISINAIAHIRATDICDNGISYGEHTNIELTTNTKIALTGNHDDNIIELSELLK